MHTRRAGRERPGRGAAAPAGRRERPHLNATASRVTDSTVPEPGRFRCPLGFGAELEAPDRTRFRLWAPGAARVELELWQAPRPGAGERPADERRPLQPAGDGWFEAQVDCGAGARYRYRVTPTGEGADTLAVPDPASRAQDGDVHDPSIVVDPAAYAWRHADWRGRPWHETVLLELHVGALGGFEGVRRRLPEIAASGITAIELMPLADFPGPRNWGYDGVLPFAPDAAYGTPDALKALVDAAHGLGLGVLLDVVYNHFGPDGNYLGIYAPGFFDPSRHTPWGMAIDFRRSEVAAFFEANARYWLEEYRFDGLRLDAVHAIGDDAWLRRLAERVRAAVEPGRHVHLVLENDDNRASLLGPGGYDAQWNDDGHHALHVLLTGEREGYYGDHADAPAERLARVLSEGFDYQGAPSAHREGRPRGEPSGALPPTAFVLFLQNHDQVGNRAFGERLAALAGPDALRPALALLLLAPQIPLLFMGDEWGATEPFLYFTSHADPALAAAVRDGRRREFEPFAAFADPARRARIPDPNDPATFEASRPREPAGDPAAAAWRAFVARLLALRRERLVPHLAGAHALRAAALGPRAVRARWRLGDRRVWDLWVNLGPDPVALDEAARHAAMRGQPLFELGDAQRALAAEGVLPGHGFALQLGATEEGAP